MPGTKLPKSVAQSEPKYPEGARMLTDAYGGHKKLAKQLGTPIELF